MLTMKLTRAQHLKDRTLGSLVVNDYRMRSFGFAVLELPYRNNQVNISCIPVGKYGCRLRTSQKYGKHLEVLEVPNRSDILIHVGNFPKDTKGCLLIGDRFTDLDGDGLKEVANSRRALKELVSLCELDPDNKITLEITNGNV